MQCKQCLIDVSITNPHEQFLFGASGLCEECRDKVYEESYRDQDDLKCCRCCQWHDWAEDIIICEKRHRPVSSVGICSAFEPAS
jgi:hypothetical protein